VLRGAESDVLPVETAAEMQKRGPKARVVEFANTGHAPALTNESSIAVVREWLSATA
jgi:pimeloyl-ACP methyl ester carboxylesterase